MTLTRFNYNDQNQNSGKVSGLTTIVSGLNNVWSITHNIEKPKESYTQAFMGLILTIADTIDFIAKNPKFKHFASVGRLATLITRLYVNIEDYDKQINSKEYDGTIKFTTILSIFSDSAAIFAEVAKFTRFNPLGALVNVLGLFATETSNSLEEEYKKNPQKFVERIAPSDIYEYLLLGAQLTIDRWVEKTASLEELLDSLTPDFMTPWDSDPVTLYGDMDENGNKVIRDDILDAYAWFQHYDYNDKFTMHGGKGNDTLIGGVNDDDLYGDKVDDDDLDGGHGDDILKGNGGNDTMLGGKGFDTYYILDKDTVYDEDGLGKIIFSAPQIHTTGSPLGGWESYDLNLEVGNFERADHSNDAAADMLWVSTQRDKEGKPIFTATRQAGSQDLHIQYVGQYDKTDSVTIKNFFSSPNVKQEDGSWSALGITLNNQTPRNLPYKSDVGTNHQVHRFTHSYIATEDASSSYEASVGWATRCPRGSHSWDFAQLFLFSADIHNISIPQFSPDISGSLKAAN